MNEKSNVFAVRIRVSNADFFSDRPSRRTKDRCPNLSRSNQTTTGRVGPRIRSKANHLSGLPSLLDQPMAIK